MLKQPHEEVALRLSSLALVVTLLVVCAGAATQASAEPVPGPHVAQLASLRFAPGSAVLGASEDDVKDPLAHAIGWALDHPDGILVLDAHADPLGPSAHDVRLSLARARAVRAYLVAAGVNPHQIVVAAFAADGSRRDRRVDVWGMRPAADDRSLGRSIGAARSRDVRGP